MDALQERQDWQRARDAFRDIWGYPDFRWPQGEIVADLLQQRDALAVMPTGSGKSICFQLPALLQNGLTVVVSPLVALMENQVAELRDRQLPAAALHTEQSRHHQRQILEAIARQRLRLLYVSPETLLSAKVWELLSQPQLTVSGLMLDEAHCLAQWGDTFRPAYQRLGAVRPALLKSKPPGTKVAIAAFTATADPPVRRIVCETLQLRAPRKYLIDPYRDNLALRVNWVWTPRGRRQQLLRYVRRHAGRSGLVYVRTRADSEGLAAWLRDNGLTTAAYHAGLGAPQRRAVEGRWLRGELPFVVSTSAFGMGVNKRDCGWICHYQAPLLLSEYVQEVGRAGRDGRPAEALTLASEPTGWLDPHDRDRQRFFETQRQRQSQQARQLAKQLPATGDARHIARQHKGGAIALAVLHRSGRLVWLDPFRYRILPEQTRGQTVEKGDGAARQMHDYLYTKHCRWQFLLAAFGFADRARGFRCGRCDRCLREKS